MKIVQVLRYILQAAFQPDVQNASCLSDPFEETNSRGLAEQDKMLFEISMS